MNTKYFLKFLYAASLVLFIMLSVKNTEAATVSLTPLQTVNTINAGQIAEYKININRDGFADKVTFNISGLPNGATAVFLPNSTTANSTVLQIKTTSTTTLGNYTLAVRATANGISIAPITVKLTVLAAQSLTLKVLNESQSLVAGQKTFFDIEIQRSGFTGSVSFTAINLPVGVSVQFEPAETSENKTRMWLFSNGLPPNQTSFGVNIIARSREFQNVTATKSVKILINCGIIFSEQGYADHGNNPDFATVITSDATGFIYAAGHIYDIPTTNTFLWVAKYYPDGRLVWRRKHDLLSHSQYPKEVGAITVESNGDVLIAGNTRTGGRYNDLDIFGVRYSSSGNLIKAEVFGDPRDDDGFALTFRRNAAGETVLVTTYKAWAYSNGDESYNLAEVRMTNQVWNNTFRVIVQLADSLPFKVFFSNDKYFVIGREGMPAAEESWIRQYNANGGLILDRWYQRLEFAKNLTFDSSGNVYVIGDRYDPNIPNREGFVEKLDSQLRSVWRQNFKSERYTNGIDLALDQSGNIIYGGYASSDESTQETEDIYLGKMTPNGLIVFQRKFAVANKDQLADIEIDTNGDVLAAGNSVGFNNVNFFYEDVFWMKYETSSIVGLSIFNLNPTNVRSGTQFIIEGANFFDVGGVYWNGNALSYSVVSPDRIVATAPGVSAATSSNITVAANCNIIGSQTNLTVTP